MTVLRALLACLWLVFGLTATAHASAMQAAEPSCHMSAAGMANMPKDTRPHHTDQSVMPCCSQPAIVALCEPLAPDAIRVVPMRLSPAPALPMTGTTVPYEPHPPKAG